MMHLKLDKIRQSLQGRTDFELHCHTMTLEAVDVDLPKFCGPGAIRIGASGNLSFIMYAQSVMAVHIPERLKAGEVVPKDLIYRLVAIDGDKTEWISEQLDGFRIQPSICSNNAVITGKLYDLRSCTPIFPEGISAELTESSLTLFVFDQIDIPLNTRTVTEITVDGEHFSGGGAKLNVAKVDVREIGFTFTKEDDFLRVRAISAKLPSGIHNRIVESLQFILARPVWWTMMCHEAGNNLLTHIRSLPDYVHDRTPFPPIKSVAFYDPTKCVWQLFAKYFEHASRHDDDDSWHPMSRFVYSAIEARAAGFDTYRLALGVAIEGILKTAFDKIYAPADDFLLVVEDVLKHTNDWQCPIAWDGEQSFRQRLRGSLGQLRSPRADDRLRTLCKMNVLSEDELFAWKKMRNETAHACRPSQVPHQTELDQIAKVTILMHKLVFQAIDYSGSYADYTTHGFPNREFSAVKPDCMRPQ
ncbi:hypothetical protein NA78x_003199 [Anatilimnocola sp. NA78]|uniref:hypothetical protein n=1 Tax=Anatilimnocola sp. NA78 TaxID=3415683 RepID=UPI003CE52968